MGNYLDHTRAGPFAQKSGSTVRYHVTDLHSDVVGLVASGGTYAGQTQFDPWGTRVASGTTGTQPAVGFQGDVTDADTGLVDMGTRLYLPSIGRFTTQDSVFGDLANPMSMNQFTYGQDNPATFIDPTGMCVGGYMFADCYNPDVQATWSEMISNTSRAETAEEAKTIVTWQSGINKMIAINTSPVFRPLPKPPAPKGSCHGLLGCIGNFVSNHGLQIVVGVAIAVTTAALVVSLAPVAIAVGGALLEGSLTGAALAIADATLVAEAGAVALENEAATDVEAVTVGGEAVAAETESGGLAEAFHYTGSQNVASIEANGLRAGSYPTPNGGLSPLQAQIDLALPPNRGLPGAALRIDVAGLRDAGYDIPEVTQVGRSYNMPGGGYEMQFPYPIPPEFIKAVP